jgi:hypothetical protein
MRKAEHERFRKLSLLAQEDDTGPKPRSKWKIAINRSKLLKDGQNQDDYQTKPKIVIDEFSL